MGLFWLESFESPVWPEKINANGTVVVAPGARSASSARTGTYRGSAGYKVKLGTGDQDDLIIVGVAFQTASTGIGTPYLVLALYGDAGATNHLSAYVVGGGIGNIDASVIRIYRGDSSTGTLLATSLPFTMPPVNTWMHFEMKARLSDGSGTVALRLDERLIVNASGLDTKNAGTATVFDTVEVSGNWSNGYDDVYIANEQGSVNTDFQGAKRVEALDPNGNGNSSQGVGNDGNSVDNYQNSGDGTGAAIATSDYVDFLTTGDKDTYPHEDSAQPTGNAVAGVMVWAYAQKTDAGSRSLIPVARLSGTEIDGAALLLINGTWKTVGDVFQTKPGGGAWTVPDVNSAEFGVKAGA